MFVMSEATAKSSAANSRSNVDCQVVGLFAMRSRGTELMPAIRARVVNIGRLSEVNAEIVTVSRGFKRIGFNITA